MANDTWQYSDNQFDNCTKNNFKKMLIISTDHDSKLNKQIADADINPVFIFFHPEHLLYVDKYSIWDSANAAWAGSTALVEQKMSNLSSVQAEDWDIRIMNVHKPKTPEYKALLPEGRKPFQSGAYELRIAAINTLINNIGSEAALAALKADIIAFRDSILSARNDQQGKEGLVKDKSQELEQQRIATAQAMYKDCASLMVKFYLTPEMIEQFFDLENIRRTGEGAQPPQQTLTLDVPVSTTKNAAVTFDDTTTFMFNNTGAAKLFICTGNTSGAACSGTNLTLLAGETKTVVATDLGAAGSAFLNVTNTDAANAGQVIIEVL